LSYTVKIALAISFILSSAALVCAQQMRADSACGVRPEIGVTRADCFKPMVFGKVGDGFPNRVKIEGIITRVTFTDISCGVLCLWGTAEIRLIKRPKEYDHEFIYVTVLCFGGNENDYVGKLVKQEALKSDEQRYEKLHCTIFINFLDSKAQPFYELTNKNPRKRHEFDIIG
jgi:hypothetical protein